MTEVSHDRPAARQAGQTPPPGEDWIAELTSDGPVREDALQRLHALLLRGARFQVSRMSAMRAMVGAAQVEDVITLAADEAMVAVLGKLGTFEGRSRFTTWAYKFAVLQAAVELRRQAWSRREVPLEAAPPLIEPRPSNRNALYKTLHDARGRLRAELTDRGHLPPTRSKGDPR